jgi:predicted transcriptional regulator
MKIPDIRKLRNTLGWTQVELAKRAGVTQSWISKIEEPGGIDRVNFETARRIVGILERAIKREKVAAKIDRTEGVVPFESSHQPDSQSDA